MRSFALHWTGVIQSRGLPLHVCTSGEAAAVLLLSGSRHIETRESVYGMTPLLWALNEVNADVVAVLRAWGASIELRDFSGRKAMDIAWWRSMPPTRRGKKCLAVIRGDADLNIFTGCQWLESDKIAKELSVAVSQSIRFPQVYHMLI